MRVIVVDFLLNCIDAHSDYNARDSAVLELAYYIARYYVAKLLKEIAPASFLPGLAQYAGVFEISVNSVHFARCIGKIRLAVHAYLPACHLLAHGFCVGFGYCGSLEPAVVVPFEQSIIVVAFGGGIVFVGRAEAGELPVAVELDEEIKSAARILVDCAGENAARRIGLEHISTF